MPRRVNIFKWTCLRWTGSVLVSALTLEHLVDVFPAFFLFDPVPLFFLASLLIQLRLKFFTDFAVRAKPVRPWNFEQARRVAWKWIAFSCNYSSNSPAYLSSKCARRLLEQNQKTTESTHCRGKHHLMACIQFYWFGFDQRRSS